MKTFLSFLSLFVCLIVNGSLIRTVHAAGNVHVQVIDGELWITGDAAGNHVQIERVVLNRFRVRGLEGTRVNGSDGDVFVVSSGIRVELNDGDDTLRIEGKRVGTKHADLQGKLTVLMGPGNNHVTINHLAVKQKLIIQAESGGDNTVRLANLSVANELCILTGAGDDEVALAGIEALKWFVDLGEGHDVSVEIE